MPQPALAGDDRFRTGRDRNSHVEAIDEFISNWTTRHSLAQLEQILSSYDVPATRIYSFADIWGMIVPTAEDELGSLPLAAPVPRLSETPARLRHTGHRVGQDSRQMLTEVLGLSNAEVDRYLRDGVVG